MRFAVTSVRPRFARDRSKPRRIDPLLASIGTRLASADEREQAHTGDTRLRLAPERAHADRPLVRPGRVEGLLGEAGRREPLPEPGREVGVATMTGPDDRRVSRAKLRQRLDRELHVLVSDVSEDAAQEHE